MNNILLDSSMLLLAQTTSTTSWSDYGTPLALLIFIAASVWLGGLAQKAVEKSSFVKGYFLGNRGLGAWALALTATVQSGGTFMGFPGYCYKHGWCGLVFIGSYMVVPLMGFAILGKRVAQLSRKTGAVTLPDLLRERYDSPALGVISSLCLILFMTIMICAQFKAGAILMQLSWPGVDQVKTLSAAEGEPKEAEKPQPPKSEESQSEEAKPTGISAFMTPFYLGMVVFAVTVVGYTLLGGFLAAVWTDLFQSVMMFIGVALLLFMTFNAVGDFPTASREILTNPEYNVRGTALAYGPGVGNWLSALGALSMFIVWPFTNFASPASAVRIMACKDTPTLRQSIILLCIYNMCIYIPLAVIAILAHKVLPTQIDEVDQVVPRMALFLSKDYPAGSFLGGLILAAPFGAVMATVSGYLVMIASGLVRDVYQRVFRPNATPHESRLLAYAGMIAIGLVAIAANVKPPAYLQSVVIFSGSCAAAAFLVPMVFACYWRRATKQGAMAALIAGVLVVVSLYAIGIYNNYLLSLEPGGKFDVQPYKPFEMDAIVFVVPISFAVGIAVSLLTPEPGKRVDRFFEREVV